MEVEITATDHGCRCISQELTLLVGAGVHKLILCGTNWATLRRMDPMLRPKVNGVKFLAYGSRKELPMIGRIKAIQRNRGGGTVE